ncbi:MAG: hypothetical protein EOP88_07700 [Verrucomicrobiaceae bacterium]|jgi:4-amino-4-deoxy-L-arabinose transferase-like glycosyltransferase|nr:MAG: hypothetical protein EOP88_07700 [Verrucomicrobiaceae bacterium]
MISRWYRSRLFWCGLAGLLLLAGAWYGRLSGSERFMWISATNYYQLSLHPTRMDLESGRSDTFIGYFHFRYEDVEHGVGVFAPAVARLHAGFSLGYWFLLLSYTAVWLGALVLWQRRKQRLMPGVIKNPENREGEAS